jgi:hypothetical protein
MVRLVLTDDGLRDPFWTRRFDVVQGRASTPRNDVGDALEWREALVAVVVAA